MTKPTPAALSYLISQYAPQDPGPCRVCGGRLEISEMARGAATYRCPSIDPIGGTPTDTEHWRRSEQVIVDRSDPDVVAALTQLRELRAAAGEDMTVPAGTLHFPHGHGQHHCYRYAEHLGDDRWKERFDSQFTHDPSHAEHDPDPKHPPQP